MIYEKKVHHRQSDKKINTGIFPLFCRVSISCTSQAFATLCAELLHRGKAVCFRARGTSMQPLFQDGDVLFVSPVEPGNIRQGDVILFAQESGRAVVHRVIHIRIDEGRWYFETKGDHACQTDACIDHTWVLGHVTGIESAGRPIAVNHLAFKIISSVVCWYSRSSPDLGWFFKRLYRTLRSKPGLN